MLCVGKPFSPLLIMSFLCASGPFDIEGTNSRRHSILMRIPYMPYSDRGDGAL